MANSFLTWLKGPEMKPSTFQTVKILCFHMFVWLSVSVYLFIGAGIFILLESGNNETDSNESSEDEIGKKDPKGWSFPSAVLFTFSLITTIGYGHICPATIAGKLFCIVYGMIGIPTTMLAIADLGKFMVDGMKRFRNRALRLFSVHKTDYQGWDYALFFLLFAIYLIAAALLLPFLEGLSLLDSVYFSFTTLTTVGFGDIYPRQNDNIAATLILLTIGLALATTAIEMMAETFRKFHFVGKRMQNVRTATIWFGGQKLTVGEMLNAVGKKLGIPEEALEGLNMEELVEHTITDLKHPPPPEDRPVRIEALRSIFQDQEKVGYMDSEESSLNTVHSTTNS